MTSRRLKPTIAIDIDDVLADSTEFLRLLVNERIGADLQPEHYHIKGEYWGYYQKVWQAHGLMEQVSYNDILQGMADDQSRVSLLPDAATAIHELTKNFNLILITARESSWESATRRWLDVHLADKFVEIYFTTNHKDAKTKNKGQLCRELGASWLIDDSTEHCQAAINEGVQAILFGDYGWQVAIPPTVTRCGDWSSVVEFFDGKK